MVLIIYLLRNVLISFIAELCNATPVRTSYHINRFIPCFSIFKIPMHQYALRQCAIISEEGTEMIPSISHTLSPVIFYSCGWIPLYLCYGRWCWVGSEGEQRAQHPSCSCSSSPIAASGAHRACSIQHFLLTRYTQESRDRLLSEIYFSMHVYWGRSG